MALLIPVKVDFRAKNKESVHQEDRAILNVYAPKSRAAKYMKQNDRAERRNRKIHNYGSGLTSHSKQSIELLDRILAKIKNNLTVPSHNRIQLTFTEIPRATAA